MIQIIFALHWLGKADYELKHPDIQPKRAVLASQTRFVKSLQAAEGRGDVGPIPMQLNEEGKVVSDPDTCRCDIRSIRTE